MPKIIQLTAKFSEGETVYLVRGEGIFQELKVTSIPKIQFEENGTQKIFYKVDDVLGEEAGCYLQENLRNVDDMLEVLLKKSPYHWEQRGMK